MILTAEKEILRAMSQCHFVHRNLKLSDAALNLDIRGEMVLLA
jgi:hypothetical protein